MGMYRYICINLELDILCSSKGGATDRYGEKIELFKDVREIFSELDSAGIAVAAASR